MLHECAASLAECAGEQANDRLSCGTRAFHQRQYCELLCAASRQAWAGAEGAESSAQAPKHRLAFMCEQYALLCGQQSDAHE